MVQVASEVGETSEANGLPRTQGCQAQLYAPRHCLTTDRPKATEAISPFRATTANPLIYIVYRRVIGDQGRVKEIKGVSAHI